MKTNSPIKLDWTQLFGFKQVKAVQAKHATESGIALISSKIGGKVGGKGGPPASADFSSSN